MDEHRVAFLFGAVPDDVDVAHPDERAALLTADGDLSPVQVEARLVVASQVLDDDPPEVWTNAARLLAAGLDRHDVLRQVKSFWHPPMCTASLRASRSWCSWPMR